MLRFINACLVIAVLAAGFVSYSLEYKTRGLERQVRALSKDIDQKRESIKLLKAEWSSLIRPERLQKLAEDNLELTSLKASQIITVEEIATRVPQEPIIKLEKTNQDPIGDIVKQME